VHGDRTAVGAAVQEKGDELEQELAKAEEEAAAAEPGTPDTTEEDPIEPIVDSGPTKPGPIDTTKDLGPQRDGLGLIIGGSAIAGVGVISLVTMVPIGAIRGKQFEEEYEEAREAGDVEEMDRAERNGAKANGIAIAGGVVGGVLIAAGVVVLTLGVVKRNRSRGRNASVSPVFNRNFAGLAVQGRF
jgi:hypothetical protein